MLQLQLYLTLLLLSGTGVGAGRSEVLATTNEAATGTDAAGAWPPPPAALTVTACVARPAWTCSWAGKRSYQLIWNESVTRAWQACRKRPPLDRVVRHVVAGALATWTPRRRWHEPEALHLVCPLVVVVPATAGFAKKGLPLVNYLVHKGLHGLHERHHGEVAGIERDFVCELTVKVGKAIARKIPTGALFALECDQAAWQLTAEQRAIEVVIGELKLGVGRGRWLRACGALRHGCTVQYKTSTYNGHSSLEHSVWPPHPEMFRFS